MGATTGAGFGQGAAPLCFGQGQGTGLAHPPGVVLGQQPGPGFGQQPGAGLGQQPGAGLGQQPGAVFGQQPGAGFGQQPGAGAVWCGFLVLMISPTTSMISLAFSGSQLPSCSLMAIFSTCCFIGHCLVLGRALSRITTQVPWTTTGAGVGGVGGVAGAS